MENQLKKLRQRLALSCPRGMKLNPDFDKLQLLLKEIIRRNGYCPNNPEKSIYTKCVCLSATLNHKCCCDLFVKE